MKDLGLLIWLTQLGLSVVCPLAVCILGSVWLRDKFSLGSWVLLVGIFLGIYYAVQGLRDSLRAMDKYIKRNKKRDAPPPISYNDHE